MNKPDLPHAADSQPPRARAQAVMRGFAVILIAVSGFIVVRALPLDEATKGLKSWISDLGSWGPVAMVALYVIATILFIPGTILTLASGALFGPVIGMICVSIGSTVGASLAFIISRYAARDRVAALASRNRHFDAIDRAIEDGGWKVVALLRLSPAIPFNAQNYLYGLTRIQFWPYIVTSWAAMLPGTFLYVYLGHVTGAALGTGRARSYGEWSMMAIGLMTTVVATWYLARLARQQPAQQMSASQDTHPVRHLEPRSSDRQTGRGQ